MDIENYSVQALRSLLSVLEAIVVDGDFPYSEVEGKQIMSALLKACKLGGGATGYVWLTLQGAANEARRRHLLFNPNFHARETYSSALQPNCDNMRPCRHGWEMTKGILMRHVLESTSDIRRRLFMREQSSSAQQILPSAPRRLPRFPERTFS